MTTTDQKKTARPVSWSRRFARTFVERSSRSPRGAAGHNPLRDREWPVSCGIPARHHHPRGAFAPCAWTVRIGPLHRFPVASSPREEVRCTVEDDFGDALQRPISGFRHREKPYGPSLRPFPLIADIELREGNPLPSRCVQQAQDSQAPVSQWDNGDGFGHRTTEGGARARVALNPASR